MDAMTFQGHGLVNFSKANGFKFCKIKNPLRHTVKLSKLWKITRIKKKKNNKKKPSGHGNLRLFLYQHIESRNTATAYKPRI